MESPIQFDGGSDADRKAVVGAHDAYLQANAAFDWPALKPIWSDDPSSVFFNMNGHTYVGSSTGAGSGSTTPSTRRAAGGSRST